MDAHFCDNFDREAPESKVLVIFDVDFFHYAVGGSTWESQRTTFINNFISYTESQTTFNVSTS